jgi:hypothetical protein
MLLNICAGITQCFWCRNNATANLLRQQLHTESVAQGRQQRVEQPIKLATQAAIPTSHVSDAQAASI